MTKIQTIREMALAGQAATEIATTVGWTVASVRRKITELRRCGRLPPSARPPSPERSEPIIAMALAGKRPAEIAAAIGWQPESVSRKLVRLRRAGKLPKFDGKMPTYLDQTKVARIIELTLAGRWPSDIAMEIGWTSKAVRGAIYALRNKGRLPLDANRGHYRRSVSVTPSDMSARGFVGRFKQKRNAQEAGHSSVARWVVTRAGQGAIPDEILYGELAAAVRRLRKYGEVYKSETIGLPPGQYMVHGRLYEAAALPKLAAARDRRAMA